MFLKWKTTVCRFFQYKNSIFILFYKKSFHIVETDYIIDCFRDIKHQRSNLNFLFFLSCVLNMHLSRDLHGKGVLKGNDRKIRIEIKDEMTRTIVWLIKY